jgi:hypothetical protein
MTRSSAIRLLALGTALSPATVTAAPPVHKDPNTGGITVTSALSLETIGQIGMNGAKQQEFCDVYQAFSDKLWVATEGQHYIERAQFVAGSANVDVVWHPGSRSNASYLGRIHMREIAELQNPLTVATLTHEFFHFYYALPDEYLVPGGGEYGYCEDADAGDLPINPPPWAEACTSLDGSSCGAADCVRPLSCYGGNLSGQWCAPDGVDISHYAGLPVVHESDCNLQGGTYVTRPMCIIDNVGDPCASDADCGTGMCLTFGGSFAEPKICNNVSTDTCIMGNHFTKSRLCNDSSHVHVDSGGRSLSNSYSILGLAAAGYFPTMSDYDCWEMAAQVHPELVIPQAYTDEVTLGSPPAMECEWFLDAGLFEPLVNAEVLADLSGSMLTTFAVNSNQTAWQAAVEGAAVFRSSAWETANSSLGVYGFHETFFPLPTDGNVDLVIGPPVDPGDPVDLAFVTDEVGDYGDPMNQPHATNLCGALLDARAEYLASAAPQTDRNLVLLTDAVHTFGANVGGDDCDLEDVAANLCAEGIKVHVLGYGNLDVETAEAISSAGCGHSSYVPELTGAMPDPHVLQVAMGAMHTKLATTLPTWFARIALSGASVDTHLLYVPPNTERLVLDIMGDTATYQTTGAGGGPVSIFNQLQISAMSPTGIHYTIVGTAAQIHSRFRELVVDTPEAGYWQLEVDASAVPAWERSEHVIGWSAGIRHPDAYVEASVDRHLVGMGQKVGLRATLGLSEPLTEIAVDAAVSFGNVTASVPMHDDGLHGDVAPGDGIYGALYTPTSFGVHTVQVTLQATAGVSRTVPGETLDGSPRPAPVTITHGLEAVEDLAFQVSRSVALEMDPLMDRLQGGSWFDDDVATPHDLLATSGSAAGSEGPDEIACISPRCRVLGRGGDDVLLADPTAELTELHGGAGDDILVGSSARDIVLPGPGADFVSAGEGDDFVIIRHACELAGGKRLSGGAGNDTLVVPPGVDASRLEQEGFERIVERGGLEPWSECGR